MRPSQYAAAIAAAHGDSTLVTGPAATDDNGVVLSLRLSDVEFVPAPSGTTSKQAARLRQTLSLVPSSATGAAAAADGSSNNSTLTTTGNRDVALRASVFDALGMYESQIDEAIVRATVQARSCAETNAEIRSATATYDKEYTYKNRVGFGVPRLVRETGIATDLAFQERFGFPVVNPDPSKYESILTELRSDLVPKGEAFDAYHSRIRRNVTQPLLPLGDGNIPNILLAVNTFALTDVLKETKSRLDSSLADDEPLRAAEKQLKQQIQEARSTEQFAKVFQLEAELQQVMTQRLDRQIDRVNTLGGGGNNNKGKQQQGLSAQLDAVLKAPGLPRVTEEKRQLEKQVLQDIEALEQDRIQRSKVNHQAIQTYETYLSMSSDQMKKNFHDQEQEWVRVVESLNRIKELGQRANTLTCDHVQVTEVEQKRRKEFSEYLSSLQEHRQYLDDLLLNTKTALDFTDKTRDFLEFGSQKVEEMNMEARLREMMSAEVGALDKLYLELGELIVRRLHAQEIRCSNAQRMQATLQHQSAEAVSALDPLKAEYKNKVHSIDSQMIRLRQVCSEMELEFINVQGRYVDTVETCNNSEDGERDGGGGPAVRILQLRADLRQKYANQLRQTLEDESEHNAHVRTDMEERQRLIDAETQRLAQRRSTRRERGEDTSEQPAGNDDGNQQLSNGEGDVSGNDDNSTAGEGGDVSGMQITTS